MLIYLFNCLASCIAYGIAQGSTVVVRGVGGERGNFMYFKYNFSFSRQKKIYIYSSILTFRYASFGDDEIGKMLYRWLDCYFTNFKPQI